MMIETVSTTTTVTDNWYLSVDYVRDRRRGTIGKGARQLASLFSVDENALSSGNQTNTDDSASASGEEERTHEKGYSRDKSDAAGARCVE